MTTQYKKPLPLPMHKALTQPFWEGAKRHELVMPRCKKCDHFFFYPRENCPNCLSSDVGWTKVSGRGRLYTYTVVRRPANPAFNEDVPYILAVVQLDEGPKMLSNLVGCKIEDAKVDMPLVVSFDDVTPEWTLVKFKPT
ncbi:MAG: Zn-ribbon domain-containing OB-fold protein [Chloroflexi bacterium]|nr:Zn-ribbon domain-containing OB-fold protein [Chloroflexota bacterium]